MKTLRAQGEQRQGLSQECANWDREWEEKGGRQEGTQEFWVLLSPHCSLRLLFSLLLHLSLYLTWHHFWVNKDVFYQSTWAERHTYRVTTILLVGRFSTKAHRSLFSAFVTMRGSAGTSSYPAPWQVVLKIFPLLLLLLLFRSSLALAAPSSFLLPLPTLWSSRQWKLTSFHFGPAARLENRCCIVNTKKKTNSPLLHVLLPPPISHYSPLVKMGKQRWARRGWGSSE